MKIKFFLLNSLICLALIFSCKRTNDSPLWNVDALAPLVQASLSMNNIVKDTSLIKKNSDNSITIVDRQTLASITLDSLVTLNTPPFNKTAKLTSLVLDTRTDTTKITLGQIADALIASGDPSNAFIGASIKSLDGQQHQNIPNLPALSFNNLPIDASTLFQDADITSGTLSIQVINNLPVDIQTLDFTIKNKIHPATIISNTFSGLSAFGGSGIASQDLSGLHVEGLLEGDIATLKLNGASDVTVDLDQSIEVILTISGVSVSAATAVFPDQDVIENDDEVSLIGLTNGIELTYAEIASGKLQVEVYSTIHQDMYFTYNVPSASKNGVAFTTNSVVPAADTAVSHITFTYDFSGYAMDLTGQNQDTINTFYNAIIGKIKYTGQQVSLSLSDSVVVSVSTIGLKPSYVRGFLGQDTINLGPSSASLDIFKNIESGSLNFENIKMNLVIDNGFGLDGSVKINNITASNSKTGATQTLTGPNIATPVIIAKATDHPYTNALNTIDMSTSSNATSLINILPNKVNYNAQVITNLAGNTGTYSDFAYNNGSLGAYLDIEMPLSLIASQLVLSDTVAFSTASIQKKKVNSGTFSVLVNNGFPLNAALKMYFLNASGTIIDSVKSSPGAILAAPVDVSNRVKAKQSSHISFDADASRMNNLYNTYNVIFKIEFTTEPNSSFLKIYSDYNIDFKIVGNMNYGVH